LEERHPIRIIFTLALVLILVFCCLPRVWVTTAMKSFENLLSLVDPEQTRVGGVQRLPKG
jgi:hypothetical protein